MSSVCSTKPLERCQSCRPGGVVERVDWALAYLQEGVLPHAHAEELTLLPLVQRQGAAPLHAEHDTLREATGHLRQLAVRTLTPATVAELAGLLAGIHLILTAHFAHESETYTTLLQHLEAGERQRLQALLAQLGEERQLDEVLLGKELL